MKATLDLASRAALWWLEERPLSKEARAKRKQLRAARRKARKGEPLTLEEEALMATQTAKVQLPDGTVIERAEPVVPLRTSSKVAAAVLLPIVSALPFYGEINGVLLQACQSEQGPLYAIGGWLAAGAVAFFTARFSRSPAKPGKL